MRQMIATSTNAACFVNERKKHQRNLPENFDLTTSNLINKHKKILI